MVKAESTRILTHWYLLMAHNGSRVHLELKTKDFLRFCTSLRAYQSAHQDVEKKRVFALTGLARAVAVSTLLTLTACGPTAWEGPVTRDGRPLLLDQPGGFVSASVARFEAHVARGDCVVLGSAASADTIFLGLPCVCMLPGSVFEFHGASDLRTGLPAPDETARLAAYYPPRVAAWFWSEAAHLYGAQVKPLTAEQIAAWGEVRICNDGE